MSLKPEYITLQPDVQENYVVYDRELSEVPEPPFDKTILVTNDHLSNRLYFNIYYTFDDRPLLPKTITIKWKNADGKFGTSICTEKSVTSDRLTFSWNVPIEATYKEGNVEFAIQIDDDNYCWNSLTYHVEVKKGLVDEVFNNITPEQEKHAWREYVEEDYSLGLTTQIPQTKDEDTLYLVKDDKSAHMTLGENVVNNGDLSIYPWTETTEEDYIYVTRQYTTIVGYVAEIVYYKGDAKKVIVPNTLGGYPVSIIHATAFNNPSLLAIKLPSTVFYIG